MRQRLPPSHRTRGRVHRSRPRGSRSDPASRLHVHSACGTPGAARRVGCCDGDRIAPAHVDTAVGARGTTAGGAGSASTDGQRVAVATGAVHRAAPALRLGDESERVGSAALEGTRRSLCDFPGCGHAREHGLSSHGSRRSRRCTGLDEARWRTGRASLVSMDRRPRFGRARDRRCSRRNRVRHLDGVQESLSNSQCPGSRLGGGGDG